jgi:hypothetical protein
MERNETMKRELFFQGDVCIERVPDADPSGKTIPDKNGAVILAEGEATGHHHAFFGTGVTMFRDDSLARDVPQELYIGHIKITTPTAELKHQEHDSITLKKGTYRIRRQREWDAGMARTVAD